MSHRGARSPHPSSFVERPSCPLPQGEGSITTVYQPPPPPPPPPPPEEPPPPLPPPLLLSLEPGAVEAEEIVWLRSPLRWLAKPTGSLDQLSLPAYQAVVAAAAVPAAASTPAKRFAHAFSMSSAMA